MIAHHFGTDEIPRQCVTPGDYVIYEGRIYRLGKQYRKAKTLYP